MLSRGVTVPAKRSRSPPPSVFLRSFLRLAGLFDLPGNAFAPSDNFVMHRHLLAHFQFIIGPAAIVNHLPAFLVRRLDYDSARTMVDFHNRTGDLALFQVGSEDRAAQRDAH